LGKYKQNQDQRTNPKTTASFDIRNPHTPGYALDSALFLLHERHGFLSLLLFLLALFLALNLIFIHIILFFFLLL
jgi:hypothetical protein